MPRKLVDHREKLAGAVLLRDEKFRAWLIEDPKAAAASVGIKLSPAEIAMIKTKDVKALERMAKRFQTWAGYRSVDGPTWG